MARKSIQAFEAEDGTLHRSSASADYHDAEMQALALFDKDNLSPHEEMDADQIIYLICRDQSPRDIIRRFIDACEADIEGDAE